MRSRCSRRRGPTGRRHCGLRAAEMPAVSCDRGLTKIAFGRGAAANQTDARSVLMRVYSCSCRDNPAADCEFSSREIEAGRALAHGVVARGRCTPGELKSVLAGFSAEMAHRGTREWPGGATVDTGSGSLDQFRSVDRFASEPKPMDFITASLFLVSSSAPWRQDVSVRE